MRVRKPTSKRVSTRLREGIKKKAAAQTRKDRKSAKKDVTWKSRHKKDLGIPSSFPYKDQIIEEIEMRKREKEEKKVEMKRAREEALTRGDNLEDADMEVEDADDVEGEGNAMAALLESAQQAAKEYDGDADVDADADAMVEDRFDVIEHDIGLDADDIEDFAKDNSEIEKSRKQFDKVFKSVVDSADVVLYVLDARDPEATRSKKIEETILQTQGKRLILLLNKVDLVPDVVIKQWLDFLGSSFPTIPIKGSSGAHGGKSFNKKLTQAATASQLLQALKTYAQKSNLHRAITVGVVGYPNVGKSSIINALTGQHAGNGGHKSKSATPCPVGNMAGVTRTLREIKIDNKLKIIDSPGIVFPDGKRVNSSAGKKDYEAKLAVLSAIPEKQVTDPIHAVRYLLQKLSKDDAMAASFKEFYSLPALAAGNLDDFTKKVLIHVARSQGRLGKGGVPNLHAASMVVLKDWREGKYNGWTLPNNSKANANANTIAGEGEAAAAVKTSDGVKPPAKVEQTTVVQEWAKEFDLDGLFKDVFGQ
jgi:nuclear GTP-binding protein